MKEQRLDYQVVPYPKMRRLEAIAYRFTQHKPMIHRRDVWERGRMGRPSPFSCPLDNGGRDW